MYQRILVPIDESATSELALKEAALLAKEREATPRLAHVIDNTFTYTAWLTQREVVERQSELRRLGEGILSRGAAGARALGANAETTLLTIVNPGDRVCDSMELEAVRWPAGLVVIGTRGRRGFRRLLLGGGAEGLIRITTKPVLLVRGVE
jgi:nucleotide-binding universal stress UspA family protein